MLVTNVVINCVIPFIIGTFLLIMGLKGIFKEYKRNINSIEVDATVVNVQRKEKRERNGYENKVVIKNTVKYITLDGCEIITVLDTRENRLCHKGDIIHVHYDKLNKDYAYEKDDTVVIRLIACVAIGVYCYYRIITSLF